MLESRLPIDSCTHEKMMMFILQKPNVKLLQCSGLVETNHPLRRGRQHFLVFSMAAHVPLMGLLAAEQPCASQ